MENKKKLILNLSVFIFYFIYTLIPSLVLYIFHLRIYNVLYRSIYLIIMGLIYIIFITFIYKDELKKDIKEIRLKTVIKYIPTYMIGLLLMIGSNIIASKITGNTLSQNEINVRETIKIMPLYMCFSSVIFAPFIEEITFRKTFRNIISNGYLFIIISGFIFGLIHISNVENGFEEFIMIMPYILMGIDLSYIYYKSDNIFTTIIIHSMHNLILLLIQLIGG
ncbi:MAG: CPBP family intramembrane metalloprotease [Bacilli bacterium]|nr:CPBP family intramembrane metalloprotease [Bacilli bacterium]MBO6195553.1 CPBP family intramembrane metalloprotease [Bacilli bacterium]